MMWGKIAGELATDFTVVAADLRGQAIDWGHFLPEDNPKDTLAALRGFLTEGA